MANRVYKSFSTSNPDMTETGAIYDIEVVKQDIMSMVRVRKGEYPMFPNRGFLINDFIFSPTINEFEENQIIEDAREQFAGDPRFRVNDIQVFSDNDQSSLIMYVSVRVLPFDVDIELNVSFG